MIYAALEHLIFTDVVFVFKFKADTLENRNNNKKLQF